MIEEPGSSEQRRGEDFADLAAAIREFQAEGFAVGEVTESVCGRCEGRAFRVVADDDVARRTCTACGTSEFIVDSADYWDEAEPVECECPCGGDKFAAAVGFSLHPDGEVRWVSVGLRCLADGAMGVYADWKINYGPSAHLVNLA
ncbi:hypothetical protein [Actinomadura sp. 9N215]|uniref:hypothetical protein n=1 Tax=Actinomadura sp. 9N215 TaxID=3375150 RepID=UPI0037A06117